MTNTPLLDLSQNPKKLQKEPPTGLTGYIDAREKEKAAQKASRGHSSAMQAEIDRRTMQTHQRQMEAQQRQQQQMMQQQMQQQYAMAQSTYAPSMMGTPSGMGAPSVMGGPSMGAPSMMGTPSVMGMPTGPGTPNGMVGMAYSSPSQMQMYQQPQYFPQQVPTPQMHVPGGWGTPSAQTPPGQYFPQQSPQGYGNMAAQQQQPPTQAYGASFDQAQAARYAQQHQGQFRR
jgi:CCR4-NOT transcriptional complex subunit CAF120